MKTIKALHNGKEVEVNVAKFNEKLLQVRDKTHDKFIINLIDAIIIK